MIEILPFDWENLTEQMRLEWDVKCYVCEKEIPKGTTSHPLQKDGYGFVWGSDGVFPDGASAMYCCYECRNFWIDPPEEENEDFSD